MSKKTNRLASFQRRIHAMEVKSFGGGVDSVNDPAVLGFGTAERTYNFDFCAGVLREGWGLEHPDGRLADLDIGTRIVNFCVFRRRDQGFDDRLMLFGQDGLVRYVCLAPESDGAVKLLAGVTFAGAPCAVNYRLYGADVIIITSPGGAMHVWDGVAPPSVIADSPLISSMAVHFERLFVTTSDHPNSVWFSDDLDPTNWSVDLDAGGFVELFDERGSMQRVISFANYLYIFREYGISRMSAFGDQLDFAVSNLFVSSGRIWPQSICVCGDIVLMLAECGLFSFDGVSTRQILGNLAGQIRPSPSATATYHDGKYYLALRMDFGDSAIGCEHGDFANNALLVVDIATGKYALSRGMDITALCSLPDMGAVGAVDASGRVGLVTRCGAVFGQSLPKVWQQGLGDLGAVDCVKNLRELFVRTQHPIEIRVTTDRGQRTYALAGSNTVSRLPLNLTGYLVSLRLQTDCQHAHISRPKLRLTLRSGR